MRLRGLIARVGLGPVPAEDVRSASPPPQEHSAVSALGLARSAPMASRGGELLSSLSRIAGFNDRADLGKLDALVEASLDHGHGASGPDRSRDILAGMRRLLDRAGVRYAPFKTPGNLPGLRIEPDPGGAALNRAAHDLKQELGVILTYSPAELRAEGYRAAFSREELRVILPHAAVRDRAIDAAAGHEIDHARLFVAFRAGARSPFFAELRSLDGTGELWQLPIGYDARFDFEEIYTHLRQLAALGRELRQVESAPAPNLARADEIRQEIATVSRPLGFVADGLRRYLERAQTALEDGTFTVWRGALGGVSALELVLPTTGAELRFRTADADILKVNDPQEVVRRLGVARNLELLGALADDLERSMSRLQPHRLRDRSAAEIAHLTEGVSTIPSLCQQADVLRDPAAAYSLD